MTATKTKVVIGKPVTSEKQALNLLKERPVPKKGGYDRVVRMLVHDPLGEHKWVVMVCCWVGSHVKLRHKYPVKVEVATSLLSQNYIWRGKDVLVETYLLNEKRVAPEGAAPKTTSKTR